MANYYTKKTLEVKVQQLEEATGSKMQLISCNEEYAIQSMGGPDLGFVGVVSPHQGTDYLRRRIPRRDEVRQVVTFKTITSWKVKSK